MTRSHGHVINNMAIQGSMGCVEVFSTVGNAEDGHYKSICEETPMPLCWKWETLSYGCILWGQVSQGGEGISSVKRTLTVKQATLSPLTFSLELFPAPVLKASLSSPILEGQLVNLSCETKLLLERPGLRLYFSFYMGSKTLLSRNTSSEYQIQTAEREDSGLYWCEATTEDGNVIKRSPELELQVLGENEGN